VFRAIGALVLWIWRSMLDSDLLLICRLIKFNMFDAKNVPNQGLKRVLIRGYRELFERGVITEMKRLNLNIDPENHALGFIIKA